MIEKWKKKYPRNKGNVFDYCIFPEVKTPIFDQSTTVATVGSCFAREIKNFLVKNNFNILIPPSELGEKPNIYKNHTFNTIYNVKNILQQFERVFDSEIYNEHFVNNNLYYDAYRLQDFDCNSYEKLLKLNNKYLKDVTYTVENSDLFIITLGLTECFTSSTGLVYHDNVIKYLTDENKQRFKSLTVEEIEKDICKIILLLRNINKDINIIFTLSPVPFVRTFSNFNAVTANYQSKFKQYIAIHNVLIKGIENVWYFPSFEYVYHNFNIAYQDDNRHIKQEIVGEIMRQFVSRFFHLNKTTLENTIGSQFISNNVIENMNISKINNNFVFKCENRNEEVTNFILEEDIASKLGEYLKLNS
mgnify:CR=1 FL=1